MSFFSCTWISECQALLHLGSRTPYINELWNLRRWTLNWKLHLYLSHSRAFGPGLGYTTWLLVSSEETNEWLQMAVMSFSASVVTQANYPMKHPLVYLYLFLFDSVSLQNMIRAAWK